MTDPLDKLAAERRQFRAAPHQAHDAGDVVTVGGVPVVLSKFGMPVLPAQEVSYTTRARRAG